MERWNAVARGADGRGTPKEERELMLISSPRPTEVRIEL
jgi:hypothetical protein